MPEPRLLRHVDLGMTRSLDLDRLLVSLDVAVRTFAVCEVRRGYCLVGQPVDAIMVHYVLAGRLHMRIDGCADIDCGPGSIVLVPPGLTPRMQPEPGPAVEVVGAENAAINIDGMMRFDAAGGEPGDLRLVAGLVIANVSGSFGLLDSLRAPLIEQVDDIPAVAHAYTAMLGEIADPGFGSSALTASLMKTCLILFLRRIFARQDAPELIGALANPRLAGAVGSVISNPAAPHTVASLAEGASMSVSTFARQFTAAFDMSPMEFVAKTRLRNAAELLRSTKLPVKVIAASIGFASRSHFSRAFHNAYGTDPSSFRQATDHPPLAAPAPLTGSRERYVLSEEPG